MNGSIKRGSNGMAGFFHADDYILLVVMRSSLELAFVILSSDQMM